MARSAELFYGRLALPLVVVVLLPPKMAWEAGVAIGLEDIEYLVQRGFLRAEMRLLDIGSQNLLNLTIERTQELVATLGGDPDRSAEDIRRICAASIVDGIARTTYLSEFIKLTAAKYHSFDVAPGLDTEILDLNFDSLPTRHKSRFDLVLNNGTTEHVVNQFNAMKVVHEALKVGGIVVHHVPSTGWEGHGYFCYHEEFFTDLAKANNYAIEDLWYCRIGSCWFDSDRFDFRSPLSPNFAGTGQPGAEQRMVPSSNICVAMRKRQDAPFRVNLELATSHTQVDAVTMARYRSPKPANSKLASWLGRHVTRVLGTRN